jgi:hypothetical protein
MRTPFCLIICPPYFPICPCPAKILRVEESPNAFGEAVTERRERMSNKSKVRYYDGGRLRWSGGLIIDSREEERRCMRNRIVVEVEV